MHLRALGNPHPARPCRSQSRPELANQLFYRKARISRERRPVKPAYIWGSSQRAKHPLGGPWRQISRHVLLKTDPLRHAAARPTAAIPTNRSPGNVYNPRYAHPHHPFPTTAQMMESAGGGKVGYGFGWRRRLALAHRAIEDTLVLLKRNLAQRHSPEHHTNSHALPPNPVRSSKVRRGRVHDTPAAPARVTDPATR